MVVMIICKGALIPVLSSIAPIQVYERHPCYVSICNYPTFEEKVLRTFAALVYHVAV